MPKPKVADVVNKVNNAKNDLDTGNADPVLVQDMDQTEQEMDNLESVVGALGNDTMQNLLMENPDIDKDLDAMSEAVIQIRNGMPPQQAASTQQKLQRQQASAEARQQDLAKKSGDETREPQGTVADLVQPPQQEEPGLTDMDHLQMIGKSQKAQSSKRFKPVKKEYKTIGIGGWFARVLSHAVFGVLTGVQTLVNQGVRLAKGGRNSAPKMEEEELRADGNIGEADHLSSQPEDLQKKPLTPMEEIERGDDDQEILDRYDQKPLIWEKRIAENPKQKPYVTVDIVMDKNKEEGTNELLTSSHASLSLHYTRRNRKNGKTERCRIKMGYYMGAGTGDKALPIAMYGSGSFITGQLEDDSILDTTIGKRYDATNKQINHILEHASHYEEGGFHSMKRNCTTFVAETTQQAGLPTGDMLQKKDLDLGAGWFLVPLIPLISPVAKAIGQKTIDKLSNKDDMSYFGMGKKMMSKELAQKYSDSNNNLMRFDAFSPSAAAERMRNGGMTMLHSTSYQGLGSDFDSKFSIEKVLLKDAILKVTGPDYKDDVETLIEKLGENQQALNDKMNFIGKVPASEKNQLLSEIVDDLQGCRKYLSEWFYSVVDGDRRLILPFNHMASILEREEMSVNKQYNVDFGIDDTRDTSDSLAALDELVELDYREPQWNNKTEKITGYADRHYSDSNSYYMALLRVFGSVQAGLDARTKWFALQAEGKSDPALARKMESLQIARKALQYDEVRKGMTQADADFAFSELPEKLRGDRVSGAEKIADIYQAFAYEKLFGGMKIWLKEAADQSSYMEYLLSRDVTEYLTDKVQGSNKDAFRMILYSIKQSLGDQATDEDVYQRFIETFEKTYLDQVLRSILDPKKLNVSAQKDIPEYLESLKTGSSEHQSKFKEYVLSVIASL